MYYISHTNWAFTKTLFSNNKYSPDRDPDPDYSHTFTDGRADGEVCTLSAMTHQYGLMLPVVSPIPPSHLPNETTEQG